jgi:hypothetical protein
LILFGFPGFHLAAVAQDDLFITVSAPTGKVASAEVGGRVKAGSVSLPVIKLTIPDAQPAAPVVAKKEVAGEPVQELLRDPFWPIGFFPEGWQTKKSGPGGLNQEGSDWKAASGKIQISGTSKLGGRTGAIINGEVRGVGDQIDILHAGKTYQWQIVGIDADGQVQLKKLGIK